jgi:hypothetical protein
MTGTRPHNLTYCELYYNPANNRFGMSEEDLEACTRAAYQVFWATGFPLAEDALLQNILADFSRPIGGLGIFVPDGSSPTRVPRIIHGIQLFPGLPGCSRDRLKTFAFEGNVDGVDGATVAFDQQLLEITADVLVPGSIARTFQLLSAEPIFSALGPFNAGESNTRTTKCRGMAYTPFELMEVVLGAHLTARQAYELLVPTLVDTGYEGICEPLVDFLTVALVKPSATVAAPLNLQDRVGLEVYVPSPAVVSHRRQHLLYRNLPALLPKLSGKAASDLALLDMARRMQDMVVDARLDHNDRTDARETARRPRTFRERLGGGPHLLHSPALSVAEQ